MDKQDKRYQQTHEKIRKTYISLWKKKPSSEISVTELTRAAKINRSSFYLHYDNVKAVKKEMEDLVFKELQKVFDRYPDPEKSAEEEIVYSFYLDVARLCSDYEDFFKVAIGRYGDIEFSNIFEETMRQKTFHLLLHVLGKNCTSEAVEDCRCLSWSFVAGWRAALLYCCENKNAGKFRQMVKAIDGDVRNNIERLLAGEFQLYQ